jgi:hypothetical protein
MAKGGTMLLLIGHETISISVSSFIFHLFTHRMLHSASLMCDYGCLCVVV